jgi:CRP/FNR family cyclic AMP-dependent transcriptional regulator
MRKLPGSIPVKSLYENLFAHPEFREGIHWCRRVYAANGVIITEGERGRDVFLVRHGTVRVTGCAELEQGGTIHPGFSDLGAGDLFGESGLLPDACRTATVSAVTDCELAVVDGEKLLAFFESHTAVGYRFMLSMYAQAASRLDQTNRQLLKVLAWGLRAHGIEEYLDGDGDAKARELNYAGKATG